MKISVEGRSVILKKNFYVDDGLKLVVIFELVISLVKDIKKLCEKGGFNFYKFICNYKFVIDVILNEDYSKDF